MNTGHNRRPNQRYFLFPLIAVALALLLGAVVMELWNAILPQVAHAGHIGYGQAVGLLVLCRLLFGNFRGGRPGGAPFRKGGWRGKWMQMQPDERERFREEWQRRCRTRPGPMEGQQPGGPQEH